MGEVDNIDHEELQKVGQRYVEIDPDQQDIWCGGEPDGSTEFADMQADDPVVYAAAQEAIDRWNEGI